MQTLNGIFQPLVAASLLHTLRCSTVQYPYRFKIVYVFIMYCKYLLKPQKSRNAQPVTIERNLKRLEALLLEQNKMTRNSSVKCLSLIILKLSGLLNIRIYYVEIYRICLVVMAYKEHLEPV